MKKISNASAMLFKTNLFKACICYFLSTFHFSPTDSLSKAMEICFLFHLKGSFHSEIFKLLYSCLGFFFSLSATALAVAQR